KEPVGTYKLGLLGQNAASWLWPPTYRSWRHCDSMVTTGPHQRRARGLASTRQATAGRKCRARGLERICRGIAATQRSGRGDQNTLSHAPEDLRPVGVARIGACW